MDSVWDLTCDEVEISSTNDHDTMPKPSGPEEEPFIVTTNEAQDAQAELLFGTQKSLPGASKPPEQVLHL
jgi:hypothetical protein